MAELRDVVRDVDQGKFRLAPQAVEDGRAVLHDDVGIGQFPGSLLDSLFQLVHLERGVFRHLPLHRECAGQLADLDRIEWLLENEQAVACVQAIEDLDPGLVCIGGAYHDLQARIFQPQVFDRLDAVPPGGHAHVDERQGVRLADLQCLANHRVRFLPLVGAVQHERLGGCLGCGAEQRRLQVVQIRRRFRREEDFPEILMDGRHVVRQENAPIVLLSHWVSSALSIGSSSVNARAVREHPSQVFRRNAHPGVRRISHGAAP